MCRTESDKEATPTIIESRQNTSHNERKIEQNTNIQCGIDVRTRRGCQYHRLKRCIEVGKVLILKCNSVHNTS